MDKEIERLYTDHHSWVYYWLRKRLNQSDDAADLAQETFVRIVRHQKTLRFDEPRALLTTIAKRILINWYHRQSIEKAYLETIAADADRYDEITPERHLQVIEALSLIDSLLNKMSARQRQTFIMSQIEGLSQQEIAASLNVSVRTVMRDLTGAVSMCLMMLAEHAEE
jgi:RNA polymerase sigma factor (sigma-70 family)